MVFLLYSDMTPEQLQREMKDLQQQGQRAYDEENWSQYEVLMQKWYLAKSYLIEPEADIRIGATYRLAEAYDQFTVAKVKGVMAWGTRMSDGAEIAVPIAMLEKD